MQFINDSLSTIIDKLDLISDQLSDIQGGVIDNSISDVNTKLEAISSDLETL